MPEVLVRKGEPVNRALKRLKNKLDSEGIMDEVRRLRAFETPTQKAKRKAKANAKRGKVKAFFNVVALREAIAARRFTVEVAGDRGAGKSFVTAAAPNAIAADVVATSGGRGLRQDETAKHVPLGQLPAAEMATRMLQQVNAGLRQSRETGKFPKVY